MANLRTHKDIGALERVVKCLYNIDLNKYIGSIIMRCDQIISKTPDNSSWNLATGYWPSLVLPTITKVKPSKKYKRFWLVPT